MQQALLPASPSGHGEICEDNMARRILEGSCRWARARAQVGFAACGVPTAAAPAISRNVRRVMPQDNTAASQSQRRTATEEHRRTQKRSLFPFQEILAVFSVFFCGGYPAVFSVACFSVAGHPTLKAGFSRLSPIQLQLIPYGSEPVPERAIVPWWLSTFLPNGARCEAQRRRGRCRCSCRSRRMLVEILRPAALRRESAIRHRRGGHGQIGRAG